MTRYEVMFVYLYFSLYSWHIGVCIGVGSNPWSLSFFLVFVSVVSVVGVFEGKAELVKEVFLTLVCSFWEELRALCFLFLKIYFPCHWVKPYTGLYTLGKSNSLCYMSLYYYKYWIQKCWHNYYKLSYTQRIPHSWITNKHLDHY